jgi:hypothetical protein
MRESSLPAEELVGEKELVVMGEGDYLGERPRHGGVEGSEELKPSRLKVLHELFVYLGNLPYHPLLCTQKTYLTNYH